MFRQSSYILLIAIVLFACVDKTKKTVIPKKDLIPLLVDLHITDAIALDNSIRDMMNNPDSASVYGYVFKKHGYQRWQFDSTMKYYVNNTEKMRELYDEVYAELSRMEKEVNENNKYMDDHHSEFIWKQSVVSSVIGDSVNYPKEFIVPIKSVGQYVIRGKIKMERDDRSINPYLIAYFYCDDSTKNLPKLYFRKTKIAKSKFAREYILAKTLEHKDYNQIRIKAVSTENPDTLFYKKTQISNFRVQQTKDSKE